MLDSQVEEMDVEVDVGHDKFLLDQIPNDPVIGGLYMTF